ncbi:MAG: helix-turn-helix domain-containing protein [Pseudomonadota bacterium]
MAADDFARNLRLLCSYGRSVSAVCRQMAINRHQLKRYLSGTTAPSLHTLRRLCDFFGLEEHEILLPHADFAALVKVRPPRLQRTRDRIAEFVAAVCDVADPSLARHYVGYYYVYFQPDRLVPEIHRALTRITLEDRCLVTKTIERYPGGAAGLPRTVKYGGIAYPRGNRLTIIERRLNAPDTAFFTVLYAADSDELTLLSGITLGISPDPSREIYSIRICWQYLGREIDLKKRVARLGQFPLNSPEIGNYIRYCTQNNLSEGDTAFIPRF